MRWLVTPMTNGVATAVKCAFLVCASPGASRKATGSFLFVIPGPASASSTLEPGIHFSLYAGDYRMKGSAHEPCGQTRKATIVSKGRLLIVLDRWVTGLVWADRPCSAHERHAGGRIAANAGRDQLLRLREPGARRRGSRGACRARATCEHECNQQSRGGGSLRFMMLSFFGCGGIAALMQR